VRTYAIANGYDLTGVGAGTASTHPVHSVSWYDVVKWSNAKSQMEGLTPVYTVNGTTYKTGGSIPIVNASANGYRLPSEKEWEWAARGGVSSGNYTYSGSNTISEVAWINANSSTGTKAVGTKAGNELGIYDMSGNLWEWCEDAYDSYRRRRGGSWYNSAGAAVANRDYYNSPVFRYNYLGFRLARNAVGAMITVQGGTLPASSGLGNQTVATFQIGKYETTWEEWQSVRTYAIANGYDLTAIGNGTASTHPVTDVNWYDVVKWSNAKRQMEGLSPVYTVNGGTTYKTGESVPTLQSGANGYRLPSEKEWEWAARGGVSSGNYTYSGSNTASDVAWTSENSEGTKAVGTNEANELGIYDMSGNVWEWCSDPIRLATDVWGPTGCLRGGDWYHPTYAVTYSYGEYLYYYANGFGFRLARNAQ
jgi:formylglycine-generating enzyme required for sulfatase activity